MMFDATKRTRGILEYVNTLKNRIRRYRAARRRFQLSIFLTGFAAGGAAMLVLLVFALKELRMPEFTFRIVRRCNLPEKTTVVRLGVRRRKRPCACVSPHRVASRDHRRYCPACSSPGS